MLNAEKRKILQPKLEENNINPVSFLATDYLNHYNEVFMLLEMIPDMPDMIEELEGWEPKSYIVHFADSNLSEKEIAIEAYNICPQHVKIPFDLLVARLNELITKCLKDAQLYYSEGEESDMIKVVTGNLVEMKRMWSGLNAIIHSDNNTEDQTSIDELLAKF